MNASKNAMYAVRVGVILQFIITGDWGMHFFPTIECSGLGQFTILYAMH